MNPSTDPIERTVSAGGLENKSRPNESRPGPGGPPNYRKPMPPRMGPPQHVSPAWERETSKCIGREVTVTQLLGVDQVGRPVIEYTKGICVAIQMQHLSVILMTEGEKILLKNVHQIRRGRSWNNPGKKPAEALGEVLGEALARAPE